jgi:hypothetical protein
MSFRGRLQFKVEQDAIAQHATLEVESILGVEIGGSGRVLGVKVWDVP